MKTRLKTVSPARAALLGLGVLCLLALCLFLGLRPAWMGHRTDRIQAKIGVINYRDEQLPSVSVNDGRAEKIGPATYTADVCCISLPITWKPGMKMRVSYRSASMYRRDPHPPATTVEADVLPYEPFSDGYVWIVFLPGGGIRIQPAAGLPGSAALPRLPKPADAHWDELLKFTRDTAVLPEEIGARLGIANYVDDELPDVFIDKEWAGNVGALAYRSGTCCLALPTHWKPGMKMLVSWAAASMYTGDKKPPLVHREVDVLPYEPFSDGYVWAVFLPGGVIRIQPAGGGPGSLDFLHAFPRPRVATQAQIEQIIRETEPKN